MKRPLSATVADRFAPPLLVLLVDVLVTGVAFTCAWLLQSNFRIDLTHWHWSHLCGLIACRLLFFLLIKPFASVVRHTGAEDALLIGQAISYGSLLAGVGSYGLSVLLGKPTLTIPTATLVTEFFVSVVLLVGIRYAIKRLYQVLTATSVDPSRPVLIYGAGVMGLYTKSILQRDRRRAYRIVGFIDDNSAKAQKTVQGIRVFTPRQAADRFLQSAAKPDVILAIANLPTRRRTDITNFLLRHQVVVKVVPSAQDWINGRLSTRQIRDVRIEDLLSRPSIRLDDAAIADALRGRVVLITGAAGSIGRELVRQLLRYGPRQLVLVDQAESALHELTLDLQPAGTRLTPQLADITNAARMRQIFTYHQPDFVFHAAAYKHVPLLEDHPYEAVRVNVMGTKILADLAVQSNVGTFVLISTDKAVNPTNVMGATKRLAEMYVQNLNGRSGTRFIVTRFGNVLGSSGSVVPIFKRQIESGGPVTVTHPDVIRYFMTIPEAGQLVLEAAVMGKGGEVFVFDMGEPVRIADLARQMIRLSGQDIALEFTQLRPGEKLREELLSSHETTLPTHHPKIKIARLHTAEPRRLQSALDRLRLTLDAGDDAALVRILKELIPEYVSNNSPYTALDRMDRTANAG